jgi:hypothetical protein
MIDIRVLPRVVFSTLALYILLFGFGFTARAQTDTQTRLQLRLPMAAQRAGPASYRP